MNDLDGLTVEEIEEMICPGDTRKIISDMANKYPELRDIISNASIDDFERAIKTFHNH